jgi:hypothetical protein
VRVTMTLCAAVMVSLNFWAVNGKLARGKQRGNRRGKQRGNRRGETRGFDRLRQPLPPALFAANRCGTCSSTRPCTRRSSWSACATASRRRHARARCDRRVA